MKIRTRHDIHPRNDLTEEIRREAYLLWKREGCPAGRELDHWLEAQEYVRHRQHLPHRTKPGDRDPIIRDGDRLVAPLEPRGPPARERA